MGLQRRRKAAGPRVSGPSRSRLPRHQVRRRDIETPIAPPTDADERDQDWSAMNWKKSLKELCDPYIEVVKRRLRRIHLRWYHATAPSMIRLLEMVGCPDTTIKLIPDIVATCRVCRTWARKAPDTKLAIRLSVRFNQCIQVDLMFYECAATPLGSGSPSMSSTRQPPDHIV